jgi:uncharacterized protein
MPKPNPLIPYGHNPFKYGAPVDGEYYLPRAKLTDSLQKFVRGGVSVVLIGPRRMGKTSFVKDFLRQEEAAGAQTLYVDIYSITSHKDFLSQLLRAIRSKSQTQVFKGWLNRLGKLRPKVSWEPGHNGAQSFSFSADFSDQTEVKEEVIDALDALDGLPKPLIVCIDEFQKVAELEDDGWLEATLRTSMQSLKHVTFVFTGSKRSLIEEMLNNSSRPFFKSCQQVTFPVFDEEFTDWVVGRFAKAHIECERDAITLLRRRVGDTPNYVQMVAFHLVAEGVRKVTSEEIEVILPRIVAQSSFAYETLLSSLPAGQQRAVRLAAHESEEIYNKDFLKRYEITSGPALASAVRALKEKGIIDEGSKRGRVSFDDPMFALWLRHNFPK